MDNNKIWESNVFSSLRDLADIDMQRLAWVGKHNEYISSFTEVIGMLYDTYDLDGYIQFYKINCGETDYYNQLVSLDRMIKHYENIGYTLEMQDGGAEKILNDSNWINITLKAKEILRDQR